MPSTNKTPILGLNQWIDTDKPVREDFNRDNKMIEEKVAILSKAGATGWDSGNMIVESGTWTPTIKGRVSAGNLTYAQQSGIYRRQGNLVFISCRTIPTNFSTSGIAGNLYVDGLPFAPYTGVDVAFPLSFVNLKQSGSVEFLLEAGGSTSAFAYRPSNQTSGYSSYLNASHIAGDTVYFVFGGTYILG